MRYTLVKIDGSLGHSWEFEPGEVPPPHPTKGRWLPDNPPPYDPKTQTLSKDALQPPSAQSINYTVAYRPLADIKRYKKDMIDADYKDDISADVTYMGHSFQSDEASQALLTATLVTLNGAGGTPPDFGWWSTNNVKVLMNLAQLNGLAQTMFGQGMVAFPIKRGKKDLVDAALTVEDVLSI